MQVAAAPAVSEPAPQPTQALLPLPVEEPTVEPLAAARPVEPAPAPVPVHAEPAAPAAVAEPAPVAAPVAAEAEAVPVAAPVLPQIDLAVALQDSGLVMVETSHKTTEATPAEPEIRLGRKPKPVPVVSDEPLMQVETHK